MEKIEIENGQAVIPESVKEEIRETYCRTYITNPEDEEVYKAVKALESASNNVLQLVKERKPSFMYDASRAFDSGGSFVGLQADKTVKARISMVKWLFK